MAVPIRRITPGVDASSRSRPRAYRSDWVWLGPGELRPHYWVSLENGRVAETGEKPPPGAERVDLGRGLLLPGLVNAHCHAELSGVSGLTWERGDFLGWVTQLVKTRPGQNREEAAGATRRAARFMAATGTALVGDITNTGLAREPLAGAGLSQVSFFEALGAQNAEPPEPEAAWEGWNYSAKTVAIHAPYSVPSGRIRRLLEKAGPGVVSIHLAESRAEMEFLAGEGPEGQRMARFLEPRGVTRDMLDLMDAHPLTHLDALGAVNGRTLMIHGVQLGPEDGRLLAERGSSLCLCPRSNLALTASLAPAPDFLALGLNLCLGTDSPASAPDLNLWAEMAEILRAYPSLSVETVYAMATLNGARALGLEEHFGSLDPGKVGVMAWVELPEGGMESRIMELALTAASRVRMGTE